jgi:hypothetical protein
MALERLMAWYSVNNPDPEVKKLLPKNILYFRDCVSDTQCEMVKNHEVPLIEAAFPGALEKKGYRPKGCKDHRNCCHQAAVYSLLPIPQSTAAKAAAEPTANTPTAARFSKRLPCQWPIR